jgi:rhodanese-related sulfurtransferase
MKNLQVRDFAEAKDKAENILLDVRTPEEFAEGHLENAINIDFYKDDFTEELNKLDKSKPYAIYCRSGHRSGITCKKMEEIGFTSTVNLDGGILQWIKEGMKVIK